MTSSSGNSSTRTKIQSSGCEEDLQVLMDQRKNKRKMSNRESARRCRMRKQNHIDDMMIQVSQLTKENSEILISVNITTHHYLNVEDENSILRAQMVELNQRLESLNGHQPHQHNYQSTIAGAYERDCYLTHQHALSHYGF